MKMCLSALQSPAAWEALDVTLPRFDVAAMVQRTKAHPLWVHFGAGNIFRGFIAAALAHQDAQTSFLPE